MYVNNVGNNVVKTLEQIGNNIFLSYTYATCMFAVNRNSEKYFFGVLYTNSEQEIIMWVKSALKLQKGKVFILTQQQTRLGNV